MGGVDPVEWWETEPEWVKYSGEKVYWDGERELSVVNNSPQGLMIHRERCQAGLASS